MRFQIFHHWLGRLFDRNGYDPLVLTGPQRILRG
jgi:hypothetical protein